jgi:transposase-like protein
MTSISFARHQFPPDVIRHAVWLYLRFTLSLRDVEEMLAERGLDLTHETVRRWVTKFGPLFARELRRLAVNPAWPIADVGKARGRECGATGGG